MSEIAEEKYFKDEDGSVYKARTYYEDYPESPREWENLGKMVFTKRRIYALGDNQIDSWQDFFLEELMEKNSIELKTEAKYNFDFSDINSLKNNNALNKFIQGNEKDGFTFDKIVFAKKINEILEKIKNEKPELYLESLSADFETEENKVSDILEIKFITKDIRYESDIDLNNLEENIYSEIMEELKEFNFFPFSNNFEIKEYPYDLSEKELFEKWKETKAAVVPIDVYEHSGITCYETANFLYNNKIGCSGFAYVDKDNKEFLNELKGEARDSEGNVYNTWKPKTEEEAKKWAEEVLKGEIETFASYLEGDVKRIEIDKFDEKTLTWEDYEDCGGFYGENIRDILKDYYGFKNITEISEETALELKNDFKNPAFVENTGNEYLKSVKENLSEFDGNVKYASIHVSKLWKNDELKLKALALYLKENGCDSPEKTFAFLEDKLIKKESPVIKTNGENIDVFLGAPDTCLYIDHAKKQFAYVRGGEYLLGKPSTTYNKTVTKVSSKKRVEEMALSLYEGGYKPCKTDSEQLDCCTQDKKYFEKLIDKQRKR